MNLLPDVFDPREALLDGASRIHEDRINNVVLNMKRDFGNVDEGFLSLTGSLRTNSLLMSPMAGQLRLFITSLVRRGSRCIAVLAILGGELGIDPRRAGRCAGRGRCLRWDEPQHLTISLTQR